MNTARKWPTLQRWSFTLRNQAASSFASVDLSPRGAERSEYPSILSCPYRLSSAAIRGRKSRVDFSDRVVIFPANLPRSNIWRLFFPFASKIFEKIYSRGLQFWKLQRFRDRLSTLALLWPRIYLDSRILT